MTCSSTSSLATSAPATADTFVDAEELDESGTPSPTSDELVNIVSMPYTADDDEEGEEFADVPPTSTADDKDELVTEV